MTQLALSMRPNHPWGNFPDHPSIGPILDILPHRIHGPYLGGMGALANPELLDPLSTFFMQLDFLLGAQPARVNENLTKLSTCMQTYGHISKMALNTGNCPAGGVKVGF